MAMRNSANLPQHANQCLLPAGSSWKPLAVSSELSQSSGLISYEQINQAEQQMLDKVCKLFEPFRQYFAHSAYSVLNTPDYRLATLHSLSPPIEVSHEKQLGFVRANVREHVPSQLIREILTEESSSFGNISNVQGLSTLNGNQLIYAISKQLRVMEINRSQSSNLQICPPVQFHDSILEVRDVVLQSSHYIAVRTLHRIYLLRKAQLSSPKTQYCINMPFSFQITAFAVVRSKCLNIACFDPRQCHYRLYYWSPRRPSQQSLISCCTSRNPVISLCPLNKRQLLLCLANKIVVQDLKHTDQTESIIQVATGQDRIYGMLLHRDQMFISRRYVIELHQFTAGSLQVLASWRHMCEESPPSVLKYHQLSPRQGYLLMHSPCKNGFVLCTSICLSPEQPNQCLHPQIKSITPRVWLLFDPGKINRFLSTVSLCCQIDQQDNLEIISIDNCNGVYLQKICTKSSQIIAPRTSTHCNPPLSTILKEQQIFRNSSANCQIEMEYLMDQPTKSQHPLRESSLQQPFGLMESFNKQLNYMSLDRLYHKLERTQPQNSTKDAIQQIHGSAPEVERPSISQESDEETDRILQLRSCKRVRINRKIKAKLYMNW